MEVYCMTSDGFEKLCPGCIFRDSFCAVRFFIIGAVEQIEDVFQILDPFLKRLNGSCTVLAEAKLYSLRLVFPLLFSWMGPIDL
jgi:hypothetical protein